MATTINLEELTGKGRVHNLSGRLRGKAARELFHVDVLDDQDDLIDVIVPPYVYSITPSFIQGMFGESVKALGNDAVRFKRHFRLVGPPVVLEQFDRGLAAILTSRDLNDVR